MGRRLRHLRSSFHFLKIYESLGAVNQYTLDVTFLDQPLDRPYYFFTSIPIPVFIPVPDLRQGLKYPFRPLPCIDLCLFAPAL
jgi:hypothetical protein